MTVLQAHAKHALRRIRTATTITKEDDFFLLFFLAPWVEKRPCIFHNADHIHTFINDVRLTRLQHSFGISGSALSRISSSLCKGTHAITINNLQSQHTMLYYGIPQGSVLGPVFSTFYTQTEAIIFSNTMSEDVPLVEFMYLVFTRMPGESYRRRLRYLLLYLCYVFRALINSLEC